MKRILKIFCMLLLVVLFSAARNKVSAQEVSVSYQTFYDDLSPYGQWIDNPDYGYVWHPDINNFRPYNTGGHWVWTDEYGWMWTSDYDWGWAPFHYGRWAYDDSYGWMWVPGYEWSPAWVEWRTGGDYYGWAPLGAGLDIGLNFTFGSYSPPYNYWCFVPRNYILSSRVYDYCLPQSRNATIINNTTIFTSYRHTNNVFVTGPGRNEVEKYTGRINPFVLRESSKPGRTQFSKNTVNVFRPRVQKNENNHFAPKNFEKYNKQNGNAFQRKQQDVANNNNNGERKKNQNNNRTGQPNNTGIALKSHQQDANRQKEVRKQQEQKNNQQNKNGNSFERRQQNINKQNDIKKQQEVQKNNFAQQRRQNEMKQQQNVQHQQQQQEQRRQQQQSNQPNQQQKSNPVQQRQNQQPRNTGQGNGNGGGNGKGHGKHGG